MTTKDYLTDHRIEYKERGSEYYLKYCPNCESETEGDFTHLSFKSDNGLFRCKKCNYSGNLWKFALDRGHYIGKADGIHEFFRPIERPDLFENRQEFLVWYSKKRSISLDIMIKYNVGNYRTKEKSYVVYHFYNQQNRL